MVSFWANYELPLKIQFNLQCLVDMKPFLFFWVFLKKINLRNNLKYLNCISLKSSGSSCKKKNNCDCLKAGNKKCQARILRKNGFIISSIAHSKWYEQINKQKIN